MLLISQSSNFKVLYLRMVMLLSNHMFVLLLEIRKLQVYSDDMAFIMADFDIHSWVLWVLLSKSQLQYHRASHWIIPEPVHFTPQQPITLSSISSYFIYFLRKIRSVVMFICMYMFPHANNSSIILHFVINLSWFHKSSISFIILSKVQEDRIKSHIFRKQGTDDLTALES